MVITMAIILAITMMKVIMKKTDENLQLFTIFIGSFYFYRSLRFLFYLKSNDKTNVLVYYPQYFSYQSKFPLLISPLIKSLKKNDLTCVVIEEPNINYKKKRSKDVIPFDLIWFLVIVLRKIL